MDRAQNDIVSVAVVLHQSGFPQIQHGRFFETLLYPVAIIPDLFRTPYELSAACFYKFAAGFTEPSTLTQNHTSAESAARMRSSIAARPNRFHPSLKELGALGLIAQPQNDLRSMQKASEIITPRSILPIEVSK